MPGMPGVFDRLLTALRGALPAPLARYYPPSAGALAVRQLDDDGTIVTADGKFRAVLRLSGQTLDNDRSSLAILQGIAAAVNTTRGTVTLLALGKPGGLAGALAARQEQTVRLEARVAEVPRLPGARGRADLARSQAAHVAALERGTGESTNGRPGRQAPTRRYGFYLIVEVPTRADLARTVQEQVDGWRAALVRGREAVAVEAEAWRGTRLPPTQGPWYLWDYTDPTQSELVIRPRRDGGAVVRRRGT